MDCRIHFGASMLVVGPTNSGKTEFILQLLEYETLLFDGVVNDVYWYYGASTSRHDDLKQRKYILHKGLPVNFDTVPPFSVIVLDDLMEEGKDMPLITALFTKFAHHKPYFVIMTAQNLFFQSKEARTRSLNTQYFVLFKSPRDAGQITTLASQMYRGKKGFLEACYEDATKEVPYSYLLIDLHQKTSEQTRLRSKILPHEAPMRAYVHKQLFNKKGCL